MLINSIALQFIGYNSNTNALKFTSIDLSRLNASLQPPSARSADTTFELKLTLKITLRSGC